ncbi:hypothetical protein EW146_g6718 [Bondarzewia mesenterica]|uniref:Histone deacetylase domain-containing protein n=1 Tax=Bondarzewia mesenterica TaxID=1095465 RepID=A0A4S4LMR7_9AGAM|nr:hypothetical protein EW146_g6718 [Bondarzewia mesenterica]
MPKQPTTAIFLQDACLQHRFIRSRDSSNVVERPERLRAVKLGLSAAIACLEDSLRIDVEKDQKEEITGSSLPAGEGTNGTNADALSVAMGRMTIGAPTSLDDVPLPPSFPIRIVKNGDVYLEKLRDLARDSAEKVAQGKSEIPDGLSQGDLYLCPDSIDAMQGALGTVCEAVDTVVHSSSPEAPEQSGISAQKAFVAIRPPGHHCGEDTPAGFCFLNNVAVAAAHAHLAHNIKRIVVLDIDLHHGNGTQSIAWQINEETYRMKLESEFSGPGAPPSKPGLQVYYGSVHDILSYPCEDGKAELVQAASVSIHGPHGQYVENIHLQPYETEEQFWEVVYKGAYSRLLQKAQEFLESTTKGSDDVMVFISCGFDASEHEYPSMSRHARKVPTSLFYRFTLDACAFADRWAHGRLVSVLEGGYSDKALLSGSMAHLLGLVDSRGSSDAEVKMQERVQWWNSDNVSMLENLTKKRRGHKTSLTSTDARILSWLDRTTVLLSILDPISNYPSFQKPALPPSSMTLRNRKKAESPSPPTRTGPQKSNGSSEPKVIVNDGSSVSISSTPEAPESDVSPQVFPKLPRVILKVGPPPTT